MTEEEHLQHARDATRLIQALLKGELVGEERVTALENMARLYPGIGWEEAAQAAKPPEPPA